MADVIVFGSLNMDLSIEADRMPQAGETLSGRGFLMNPGGKGANQAVAAARMGARVHMVGAVGEDVFGDRMVAALSDAGVSSRHVRRLADVPTGVASIARVEGDNRIILDAGANRMLAADDVSASLDALAKAGDVFLTQLECSLEATLAALSDARVRGMYTVLNPAPACPLPESVWADVDLVCANETECEAITGVFPHDDGTIRSALKRLAERGVPTVALTLGDRGSAVLSGDRLLRATPPRCDAVDTTCAGDTYIGALVAGLAGGMDIQLALAWASAASALATTRVGAQQSIPSREEVEALAGRAAELVRPMD